MTSSSYLVSCIFMKEWNVVCIFKANLLEVLWGQEVPENPQHQQDPRRHRCWRLQQFAKISNTLFCNRRKLQQIVFYTIPAGLCDQLGQWVQYHPRSVMRQEQSLIEKPFYMCYGILILMNFKAHLCAVYSLCSDHACDSWGSLLHTHTHTQIDLTSILAKGDK